jgi:hypothetical protein
MKKKFLETIGVLRTRQAETIGSTGYRLLAYYLHGYCDGVSTMKGIDYEAKFHKWFIKKRKKYKESSFHWSGYIIYVMAGGDDEKARQLLLDLFEEFLNEEKE